jgi:cytoskeletal protein CcmA (bactofilin family)
MFTLKKKPPPIRGLIGEGMQLRGELRFTDGLRIDGEVFGDVLANPDATSMLVITENARVHGRVVASHVIINGEVRGPVSSDVLLELQPRARITGDVRYELLEMHQGAMIDGELRPLKSANDKPALKLAASNEH